MAILFSFKKNSIRGIPMKKIFVYLLVLFFIPAAFSAEISSLEKALEVRDLVSQDKFVVLTAGQQDPFIVSQEVEDVAYERNKNLNESILFFPNFLRQTSLVRKFLHSPHHFGGKHHKVKTEDKETIHYTYFNRGSDTLVVIGGGLNNQEKISSFVKIFDSYDVVIYNPRGIEYEKSTVWDPFTWRYWLSSHYIFEGMNGRKMKLGRVEEKDVFAVVDDIALKRRKKYKRTFGVALCYSAPVFAKAAVVRPGLFDKLILDGSWVSVQRMLEQYARTLWEKDDEYWVHQVFPTKRKWFIKSFLWFIERVSGLEFRSVKFDFYPYFEKLTTPTLFVHSVNDLVAPTSEFREIWSRVPSAEKTVILSTYEHVRNHIKRKELYKYLAHSFFELEHEAFLASLTTPVVSP